MTSPPYWNKADYGDGGNNLGNVKGYLEFIESLRPAFAEVFRVLAPGRKFCVNTANVNQHTEHGLLTFPLATDLVILLRELGFVLVNEIIWNKDGTGRKWGSANGQRPIFGSPIHTRRTFCSRTCTSTSSSRPSRRLRSRQARQCFRTTRSCDCRRRCSDDHPEDASIADRH